MMASFLQSWATAWASTGEASTLGTPPTVGLRLGVSPLGSAWQRAASSSQNHSGGGGKQAVGRGCWGLYIGEACLNVRRKDPKPPLSPTQDLI
jgi:hypothetical protein